MGVAVMVISCPPLRPLPLVPPANLSLTAKIVIPIFPALLHRQLSASSPSLRWRGVATIEVSDTAGGGSLLAALRCFLSSDSPLLQPPLYPSHIRRLFKRRRDPRCRADPRMAWLDGSGVDPSGILHPCGVLNRTNVDGREEDENCEPSIELLDALLPRPQTEEERAWTLEGFRMERLDKQLRLSRKRRGEGAGEGGEDDGPDGDGTPAWPRLSRPEEGGGDGHSWGVGESQF